MPFGNASCEYCGKLVYKTPTLLEQQQYCKEQMATLYPEVKRITNPHGYYVDLTIKLLNLKKQLILESKGQVKENKETKKYIYKKV